jgi:hypothetical protein
MPFLSTTLDEIQNEITQSRNAAKEEMALIKGDL